MHTVFAGDFDLMIFFFAIISYNKLSSVFNASLAVYYGSIVK